MQLYFSGGGVYDKEGYGIKVGKRRESNDGNKYLFK